MEGSLAILSSYDPDLNVWMAVSVDGVSCQFLASRDASGVITGFAISALPMPGFENMCAYESIW